MTLIKVIVGLAGFVSAGAAVVLYVGFGAFLPWRENAEANHLAELAAVRAGQTVAEIGAGGGRFSAALARRVGSGGRVFATELPGASFDRLIAARSGVPNLTVVRAERSRTGLPDACCDLVLLRNVYHHQQDPSGFLQGVRRALRPGGRLVIIDFEPGTLWFHGGRPADASARRPGHGVRQATVTGELEAAGYRVEHTVARWSWPMWCSVAVR